MKLDPGPQHAPTYLLAPWGHGAEKNNLTNFLAMLYHFLKTRRRSRKMRRRGRRRIRRRRRRRRRRRPKVVPRAATDFVQKLKIEGTEEAGRQTKNFEGTEEAEGQKKISREWRKQRDKQKIFISGS